MKKIFSMLIAALAAIIGIATQFIPERSSDKQAPQETAIAQERPDNGTKSESTNRPANDRTSKTQSEELACPIYETSRGGQRISRVGYTLSYDADYKTPQWVGWTLTAEKAEGTVPREKNFYPDPDVRGAKAYPKDYTNSGYDRGHMAPAGDMKWSHQAMLESFYLSNVCPQNKNLNRGDWKELEELERQWALSEGTVSITAGPIYSKKNPLRIGANKVAVPDGFFKVILVNYPDAPKAYGFIFRNEAGSHPLSHYQLSVNEVERRTGMDFFPGLSEEIEERVPELF